MSAVSTKLGSAFAMLFLIAGTWTAEEGSTIALEQTEMPADESYEWSYISGGAGATLELEEYYEEIEPYDGAAGQFYEGDEVE